MTSIVTDIHELEKDMQALLAGASSVFIITDETVGAHCLPRLLAGCPSLETAEVVELEPGEHNKSLEICGQLWSHLLERNADRNSILVNLGGGVITDLGGFIASTFKRGVSYLNIPTSLMAMVDASIGGKTGIDHDHVKNVVGTIYPARATLIYPPFLETLGENDMLSGFAEMLKAALVADESLWHELSALDTPDAATLAAFIERCTAIKLEIVSSDPTEQGRRKLLNLGHTFGHALESCFIHSGVPITHGACVAYGLMAEALLARKRDMITTDFYQEIRDLTRFYPLDAYTWPQFSQVLPYLLNDKKNKSGEVRFVLLLQAGSAEYDMVIPLEEAEKVYTEFFGTQING